VLPPGLGLEFRDFLLGNSLFPPSVVLHVEVALEPVFSDGSIGMLLPERMTRRIPNTDLETVGYSFMVFGMTFMLLFDLGKTAGLRFGNATSIAEPPHPILLTDVRMSEAAAGCDVLKSTAKRVGRLAHSSTQK
jgi:hypothetical protein